MRHVIDDGQCNTFHLCDSVPTMLRGLKFKSFYLESVHPVKCEHIPDQDCTTVKAKTSFSVIVKCFQHMFFKKFFA